MLPSLPSQSPLATVPYTDCAKMYESHFSDIAFAPHQSFHTIHSEATQTGSGSAVKLVSPTTSDVDRAKQDMKREDEINKAAHSNSVQNNIGSGAVKSRKKPVVKRHVKSSSKKANTKSGKKHSSSKKRPSKKKKSSQKKSSQKKSKKKTKASASKNRTVKKGKK